MPYSDPQRTGGTNRYLMVDSFRGGLLEADDGSVRAVLLQFTVDTDAGTKTLQPLALSASMAAALVELLGELVADLPTAKIKPDIQ
jgi:hypothetical protein